MKQIKRYVVYSPSTGYFLAVFSYAGKFTRNPEQAYDFGEHENAQRAERINQENAELNEVEKTNELESDDNSLFMKTYVTDFQGFVLMFDITLSIE